MEEWVKPHGHLMDVLTVKIHVEEGRLSLREFCESAAPCRSIELTVLQYSEEALDLSDLAPLVGSLVCLGAH